MGLGMSCHVTTPHSRPRGSCVWACFPFVTSVVVIRRNGAAFACTDGDQLMLLDELPNIFMTNTTTTAPSDLTTTTQATHQQGLPLPDGPRQNIRSTRVPATVRRLWMAHKPRMHTAWNEHNGGRPQRTSHRFSKSDGFFQIDILSRNKFFPTISMSSTNTNKSGCDFLWTASRTRGDPRVNLSPRHSKQEKNPLIMFHETHQSPVLMLIFYVRTTRMRQR